MSNRSSRRRNKSWSDPLQNIPDETLGIFLFDNQRLTTPETIDSYVQQFCRKVSPKEVPIFVGVQPLGWSRQNYCNKNVERMIQLHGGRMVLGYKIWYVPRLYIEAERHAIWQNPDGELIDITFNTSGETKILFLPAPALKTVIAYPHTKPREAYHPRVRDFIETHKKVEQFQSQFFLHDDTWEGWAGGLSFEKWSLINKNQANIMHSNCPKMPVPPL